VGFCAGDRTLRLVSDIVNPDEASGGLSLDRRDVHQDVRQLLQALWEAKGTDLLLTSGAAPLIRVDGEIRALRAYEPLSGKDTVEFARNLLSARQWEDFYRGTEIDFSFSWENRARMRGNVFRQRGDVAIALRMIPRNVPGFDELRLPSAARSLGALKQGLVLVTGPTGSGKSTTLASVIDWINTHRAVHILTIEDPIEYVHEHKRSAVSQRQVGDDTDSFAQALRSALREDPDVLLVGEMRDLESIRFALTLAETGHLVFATVHTNDTVQAIDRLIDVFLPEQQPQIRVQLAGALTAVIYQRLLPRIGGGMVAAYEVLVANSAIRNLIKEGKSSQLRNQIITGQREGMQTLETSLNQLVREGLVTYEEAVSRASFPKDVEAPYGAVPGGHPAAVPGGGYPAASGAPAGPPLPVRTPQSVPGVSAPPPGSYPQPGSYPPAPGSYPPPPGTYLLPGTYPSA
jgi:twitching motility protein PilT